MLYEGTGLGWFLCRGRLEEARPANGVVRVKASQRRADDSGPLGTLGQESRQRLRG